MLTQVQLRRKGVGDTCVALACSLGASLVFVQTIHEDGGLLSAAALAGAPEGPAWFWYLAAALGTPFRPGWSPYANLWWLGSLLPLGPTVRALSLISAAFAALTVGVLVLTLRELGTSRTAAAAAALVFAFGDAFWSQATAAEIGAVQTAIAAGIVFFLIRSTRAGKQRHLWLASGLLALGLVDRAGLLLLLPLVTMTAAYRERRGRIAILAATLPLTAAALALYAYSAVRLLDPYRTLDAPASWLELAWRTQFVGASAALAPPKAFLERVVQTVAGLSGELGFLGSALLVAGFLHVQPARRRPAAGLVATAALTVVFVSGFRTVDTSVLLVPVISIGWLFAGVGLDWWLKVAGAWPRPLLALLLAGCLPALQLAGSYPGRRPGSRDSVHRWYRQALLESWQPRSAVIGGAAIGLDRFLLAAIEDAARTGKQVARIPLDSEVIRHYWQSGHSVYAWPQARQTLESHGLFFEPTAASTLPLGHYLQAFEAGSIGALATGGAIADVLARQRETERAVPGGPSMVAHRQGWAYAWIGVPGTPGSAKEASQQSDAALSLAYGERIGRSDVRSPVVLYAAGGDAGTVIRVNEHEIARGNEGIAVAVLSKHGDVLEARVITPGQGLRVPLSTPALSLWQVEKWEACAMAGPGWIDITGVAAAGAFSVLAESEDATRDAVVVYLSGSAPLRPSARERSQIQVRTYGPATADRSTLQSDLQRDGLADHPLAGDRYVYRLDTIPSRSAIRLDVGGVPGRALARVSGRSPASREITICPTPLARPRLFEWQAVLPERIAPGDEELFGGGWHDREHDPFDFRWSGSESAAVLVPSARAGALRVRAELMPAVDVRTTENRITLRLNGTAIASRRAEPGWKIYEWMAPATVWKTGVNELRLEVNDMRQPGTDSLSHDLRSLGLAVRWIDVEMLGGERAEKLAGRDETAGVPGR